MVFAMEELVRVGKIYFPTLDTLSEEFKNFRGVVDSSVKYRDIVTIMHAFNAWRRDNILRGCLDMIAIGKVDDLRVIWVARPRVDIGHACVLFRHVLFLRENIDLQYSFGSIEAIGVWPAPGASTASVSACEDMLNSWTEAGDFNDLDNLRAFQVRCMFDPPSVKCMGGEFAGSAGEAVEDGAGQAVEDDSHCEEDLEQGDHFHMRVVDAFPPC